MINRKATEKLLVARDVCCSTANTDDGSCYVPVLGCTVTSAINFDSNAEIDDGSCQLEILGLNSVELGDRGVLILADAVKTSSLISLSLQNNFFTSFVFIAEKISPFHFIK